MDKAEVNNAELPHLGPNNIYYYLHHLGFSNTITKTSFR
jgi:hypothetical protein